MAPNAPSVGPVEGRHGGRQVRDRTRTARPPTQVRSVDAACRSSAGRRCRRWHADAFVQAPASEQIAARRWSGPVSRLDNLLPPCGPRSQMRTSSMDAVEERRLRRSGRGQRLPSAGMLDAVRCGGWPTRQLAFEHAVQVEAATSFRRTWRRRDTSSPFWMAVTPVIGMVEARLRCLRRLPRSPRRARWPVVDPEEVVHVERLSVGSRRGPSSRAGRRSRRRFPTTPWRRRRRAGTRSRW